VLDVATAIAEVTPLGNGLVDSFHWWDRVLAICFRFFIRRLAREFIGARRSPGLVDRWRHFAWVARWVFWWRLGRIAWARWRYFRTFDRHLHRHIGSLTLLNTLNDSARSMFRRRRFQHTSSLERRLTHEADRVHDEAKSTRPNPIK
jgi:hypothetical protein